ncbi:substrate-binding domain-containing protein [Fundicoccus sp. Sow4_H7]|uniref:substrate-binding domain-containing protein n=1 Tax=Fundicoccus sp. Sow4_H7 TaxID=3438784 RepID=UPI003F90B560
MVTIKEVSRVTGYSQATISRLFKNDPTLKVKNETKMAIYDTAVKMGYPMEKIRFAFDNILFLYWITDTDELHDDYFQELYKQIIFFANKKNLSLKIVRKGNLSALDLGSYQAFIAVGSFSTYDLKLLEKNFSYGVYVESLHFQNKFDSVNPDLEFITKKAVRLFLDKGYRKIGFMGGSFFSPDTHVESRDIREVHFRNYLQSYNLLQEKFIFSGGKFSVENGKKLARKMLAQNENASLPQALVVASDTIAIGVLEIFDEANIQLPDDLEMISINNIVSPAHQSQILTSFAIDIREISQTAINLLYEQLTYQRKVSKNVSIGSLLVERQTFLKHP